MNNLDILNAYKSLCKCMHYNTHAIFHRETAQYGNIMLQKGVVMGL